MKNTIAGLITFLMFALPLSAQDLGAFEPESPGHKWISHIFSTAEINPLQNTPYELSALPGQLEGMGLDGDRVVFGQKYISFDRLETLFSETIQDNPVTAESLTDWIETWHGASVYTRVYRVGDNGYIIAYTSPYIIIADLGSYEDAVERRELLISQNQ